MSLPPSAESSVYKHPSRGVHLICYPPSLLFLLYKTQVPMDHGAFLLCFYRERWFRAYYDLSGLSEGNTCYLNICRLQLFSKSNEATKCLSSGPCSSKIQTDPCYAVSPVARKVHYVEHTKESASSTRPCTTGSGCRGYISIFQAGSTFFATFDFFPNEPKSGKDNHMVCWLLAAGITKKNTAEGMK